MPAPAHVVAAVDDISALTTRRLDPEDRQQRIQQRRTTALLDHMDLSLNRSRDLHVDDWDVHIGSVDEHNGAVELRGVKVARRGIDLKLDPHRLFANPPMMINDVYGDVVRRGRKFRVDPAAAMLVEILNRARRGETHSWGPDDLATVLTVYGDPADGYVQSDNATYATARSGGTLVADSTALLLEIGQVFNNPGYTCRELFFAFVTSALTTSALISQTDLSFYAGALSAAQAFTMNVHLKDWSTTVDTGDWVAGASITAQTLLATLASASVTQNAYNQWIENSSNLRNNVNVSGTTRMMMSSSRHSGNNAPVLANQEVCEISFADNTGTTQDPKLVVTYDLAQTTYPIIPIQAVRRASSW